MLRTNPSPILPSRNHHDVFQGPAPVPGYEGSAHARQAAEFMNTANQQPPGKKGKQKKTPREEFATYPQPSPREKMGHKYHHLMAIFVAIGTFVVTILFTSGAFGHKLGLFVNNTIKLSDKYNLDKYSLEVTPADWTFLLTAVIYLWQAVWLAYGLSLVCRKSEGEYIYVCFPVIPPILYVVFSFSLACNVAWLLIWDKQYMEVALVFINLMTCTLYICMMVSMRRLNEYGALMMRQNLSKDIWALRFIVQNGLGLYASWGTVAAVFNFAIVLTYKTGMTNDKQEVGSTVSLIIFSLEILAWFILDNFVFEKTLRYLVTPYGVVVISLIGILSKNWDHTKRNSIYTACLLGMVMLLGTMKLIMSAWRHYKRPVFTNNPQKYRRPVVSFEVRGLLEQ